MKIVDYCPPGSCRGTFDLSQEAFQSIADTDAGVINSLYLLTNHYTCMFLQFVWPCSVYIYFTYYNICSLVYAGSDSGGGVRVCDRT